jgi:hypothetical protein
MFSVILMVTKYSFSNAVGDIYFLTNKTARSAVKFFHIMFTVR